MSSHQSSQTMAGLRWIVGASALLATLVVPASRASGADKVVLSCTAKRHAPVLDAEKVDKALAAGDLSSSMSEAEAQAAITKLSASALKCIFKPGDKVSLVNTSVVRDPIWVAVGDDDSSCAGMVFGKAAFDCRSEP